MTERRPPDRRARIVSAAAALFRSRGYQGVGIDEIGEAAGVTGPAVYRHFATKEAILVAAVSELVDAAEAVVDRALARGVGIVVVDALVAGLVDLAIDRRDFGALWQRELRHVPTAEGRRLQRRQENLIARCVSALRGARPDLDDSDAALRVQAALGVITSISYHDLPLARARTAARLRTMTAAVLIGGAAA